jgi:hypothetical protein
VLLLDYATYIEIISKCAIELVGFVEEITVFVGAGESSTTSSMILDISYT